MLQIGKKVKTNNGVGVIVSEDGKESRIHRWGIELAVNPFSYSPCYYFPTEIEEIVE